MLYPELRHMLGQLADDLDETDKRAGARLLDATLYFLPLMRALDNLRQHFAWLGVHNQLDEDIAALCRQVADNIYEGIQFCIFTPPPRDMDQSRFLMEVEFLLYDFNARPESLADWRDAQPFRRNQLFGFGQVRQRRERDLGVAQGQVLSDRDEYSVHSAQVHPRPAHEYEPTQETPEARRQELMLNLGDLFEHAVRVTNAVDLALPYFMASEGAAEDMGQDQDDPLDDATIQHAISFVNQWLSDAGIPSRPT